MPCCGECIKMETDKECRWGNEYYCIKYGKFYPINKDACQSFIEKPSGGYKRFGIPWYIVSIICKKLGLSENNEILNTSYKLRNYLLESNEGINFLDDEYNLFGVMISKKLEKEDLQYINELMTKFLIPSNNAIKNNNFEEAKLIYLNMFNELKERYNYNNTIYYNKGLIRSKKASE